MLLNLPMYRIRRAFVLITAGSLLLSLCAGAQTRPKKAKRAAATARKPAPEPQPQPVVPPPPPTPEQMPPVQPQVTLQDGQLSIVAQNSTLRDVLSAVHARTGAALEVPGDLSNDRIVVRLGPGAPRDVLAQLLQGSRFDYVILGYADNPNGVQRVILTARAGTPGPSAPNAMVAGSSPSGGSGAPGPRPAVRAMPPDQVEEPDNDVDEQQPEPAPVPAAQPPAPEQVGQPGYQPPQPGQPQFPGQNPAQPPVPGQPNPNPQIKTPEQLLQELQRMQQQQQQQPQKPPQ